MSKNSKLYYSSLLIPFFSLPSFAIDAIENGSANLDFRFCANTFWAPCPNSCLKINNLLAGQLDTYQGNSREV